MLWWTCATIKNKEKILKAGWENKYIIIKEAEFIFFRLNKMLIAWVIFFFMI